jgi:hypothetical protein
MPFIVNLERTVCSDFPVQLVVDENNQATTAEPSKFSLLSLKSVHEM